MSAARYLFLDWDGTCMDTDAFKNEGLELMGRFFPPDQVRATYSLVYGGGYSFEKHFRHLLENSPESPEERERTAAEYGVLFREMLGRLKDRLYPDARSFLDRHAADSRLVILTFGEASFQHQKIDFCGYGDAEVIVCLEDDKIEPLSAWLEAHGEIPGDARFIFVDDKQKYVDAISGAFPHAHVFRIDRSGSEVGPPEGPVIRTLEGFDERIAEIARHDGHEGLPAFRDAPSELMSGR